MGCPPVFVQASHHGILYRKRLELFEVIFWKSELKCASLRLVSRDREYLFRALCILLQPLL